MTDDRLNLIITADANQATTVVKGFGASTTAELKKVEQTAGQTGANAGNQFGNNFTNAAKGALAGLAQVAAGIKIGQFLEQSAEEAAKFARSGAAIDSTLKATGGVANVTKGHIDQLAESIQNSTAIYSGNVRQAGALLLTYTDIRNRVGEGNNVYDRAIHAATNLSAVTGVDLVSATQKLGRALENPVIGLRALTQAGIVFNAAGTERIKTLAKEGDLLGAQKELLTQVERKYGDAAANIAKADPFQRLRTTIQDLKKDVGSDLLPLFNVMANAVGSTAHAFEELPGPIRVAIEAGAGFVALSATLAGVVRVASAVKGALGVGGAGASAAAAQSAAVASQAAAEEALAAATAELTAAQAALNAEMSTGAVELGAYTAASGAVTAAETAQTAATERLAIAQGEVAATGTAAGVGLGAIVGGAAAVATAVGVAALAVRETNIQFEKLFGRDAKKFRFDTAQASLTEFARTGQATGLVADVFGEHLDKLQESINRVGDQSAFDKIDNGLRKFNAAFGAGADTKDFLNSQKGVKELDSALADMVQQGGQARAFAIAAFDQITAGAGKSKKEQEALNRAFNDYLKAVKEGGSTGASDILSGQVAIAEQRFRDLLARKAGGEHIPDRDLASARSDLISVTTKQAQVEKELAAAEGSAAADTSDAVFAYKSLDEILKEVDGTQQGLTNALTDFVNGPLAQLQAVDSIAGKLDAVDAAEKKVADDMGDIAGTSDKAVDATRKVEDAFKGVASAGRGITDANRRLQDSYRAVADATQRYKDATRDLADAERELAEFNSPRGQLERHLQQDIINRRVPTSPEEEDQKRLDLMQFEDRNADQERQLQERVAAAHRSVTDALQAESDAQQGVVDAKQNVIDATDRERDAEEKLKRAVEDKKKVATEAEKDIEGDVRKVKLAVGEVIEKVQEAAAKHLIAKDAADEWLLKIKEVADQDLGNSKFGRSVDKLVAKEITGSEVGLDTPLGTAVSARFNQFITGALPPSAATEGERELLHALGIPGFKTGGIVPGGIDEPQLILAHGGERVLSNAEQRRDVSRVPVQPSVTKLEQVNHFYGGEGISRPADLNWANAQLAWRVARLGRGS